MKISLHSAALLAAVLSASSALAADVGGPAPFSFSPTAQTAVDGFIAQHPGTFLSIREAGITRVYGKAFSTGASPVESADAFVGQHAGMFGVAGADLLPLGPFADGARLVPLMYDAASDSYKFTLVTYTQHLNGIPVFRSDLRVLVRNEAGFPAVMATAALKDMSAFSATFTGKAVSPSSIDTKKLARWAKPTFGQLPAISGQEMVIWAGVDDALEAPTLAYKFVATVGSVANPLTYQKLLMVVDAANGHILYTESEIRDVVLTGSVTGLATQGSGADLCGDEVATGLPYAAITGGTTTGYTDVNGNFSYEGGSPVSLTSTLNGLYFKVADSSGAAVSSQTIFFVGNPTNFVHNSANTDAKVRAQVNCYLQANVIRDVVVAANPSYPVISGQVGASSFQINANLSSTCNAFYDGGSINFYQSGGGCANTGYSTVVHHEFGHHVVQSGGSGQGAYGEGLGDIMGILTVDESVTGYGFSNNCASGIRNADNTCQYSAGSCSTCGSEIHACGQLISGCVWDLRNNWLALYPADYRTRLRDIVVNSVPLHGPVSTIASDIVIDYLTLDDDNGDINDGSPNYTSIADAFAQHGLNAPAIQPLKFVYPNGVPAMATPNGTTLLTVEVQGLGGSPQSNTGKFFYRVGTAGAFTAVNMTETSANHYQVALPASACLSTLQFYVQANTTTGVAVVNPTGAPSTFYAAISAAGSSTPFSDTMETATAGWQAGVAGDNATTGVWVRVDPNGTSAQPENDHTDPGSMCWVTGQGSSGGGVGENDIDGGTTTLVSPTFDATGWDAAYVSYWRWYSNDQGASPNADSMPVQISNNNGTSWVTLETVSENANAWVFKSFKISDYVTPTATMKVRWQASDLGSGSVVEAGVDDFAITGYDCTAANPADLNGDGTVDAADLSLLLGAWGTSGPTGDINNDGTVDAADLSLLLGAWG